MAAQRPALKRLENKAIAKLKRLISAHNRASIEYNRDCSLRLLPRGKIDEKREKLREQVVSTWNQEMRLIQQILTDSK